MFERFAIPREVDIDVYDGEAIASVFGTEIGILTFYEFDDHLVVSEVSIVEGWQREGIATAMADEVVGEKQKPMYHGFFETEEGRVWAEFLVRRDPEWHKMSSVKKVERASSSKIAMDEDAWLDLAKNFDSFEEFSRAISIEGVRPRAWHLSDDLNFEPDPDFHPLDRGGAETYNPVLFLTAYPVLWTDEHYLSDRAIAVEYDITDLRFGEDYISDQSGNEGLVVYPHAYDKLREIGRYNVSVAEDRAELQQQSTPKSKEEARRIYNESHGVVSKIASEFYHHASDPVNRQSIARDGLVVEKHGIKWEKIAEDSFISVQKVPVLYTVGYNEAEDVYEAGVLVNDIKLIEKVFDTKPEMTSQEHYILTYEYTDSLEEAFVLASDMRDLEVKPWALDLVLDYEMQHGVKPVLSDDEIIDLVSGNPSRRFSKCTTASMYECNICGKQFDSLGKAKSHVKRVHKIGIEYERKVITSETGTTVVLLDTEHPDSVISPEDGGRWALLCDDHQIIVQDTNKRRLIDIMYESSFWCEYCEQIVRG